MGDENIYLPPPVPGQPTEPEGEYVKKIPRPLTKSEMERAREQKRLVHQLAPELIPIISEMTNLGLIDGWRSVTVTPIEEE
ncbi:hypothetical protein [Methylophilus sp. QUAN]|uniref:hypothetical protein n=1 Tax=Methylophilus sp. QUAN TaxID=2781020 RepID=UPI00188E7098|nr:hypothetical protein [Methylophilus sp. QUAN]MBF4991079.1 hypothetical protein [Methylophilus sp. QUAN]